MGDNAMKFLSIVPIILFGFQLNAYAADAINNAVAGQSAILVAQNDVRDNRRPQSDPREKFKTKLEAAKASHSGGSDAKSPATPRTGLTHCSGQNYALCAGSTCRATGRKISVKEDGGKKTVEYPEAECTCPVIDAAISVMNGLPLGGVAALNEGNMNGSCDAPAGHVWSYFSQVKVYPQESATPTFKPAQANVQVCPAGSQGVNCWNYLCKLDEKKTNGAQTATCSCPIGEGYFGGPVVATEGLGTEAGGYFSPPSQACSMLPVSGPVPSALM